MIRSKTLNYKLSRSLPETEVSGKGPCQLIVDWVRYLSYTYGMNVLNPSDNDKSSYKISFKPGQTLVSKTRYDLYHESTSGTRKKIDRYLKIFINFFICGIKNFNNPNDLINNTTPPLYKHYIDTYLLQHSKEPSYNAVNNLGLSILWCLEPIFYSYISKNYSITNSSEKESSSPSIFGNYYKSFPSLLEASWMHNELAQALKLGKNDPTAVELFFMSLYDQTNKKSILHSHYYFGNIMNETTFLTPLLLEHFYNATDNSASDNTYYFNVAGLISKNSAMFPKLEIPKNIKVEEKYILSFSSFSTQNNTPQLIKKNNCVSFDSTDNIIRSDDVFLSDNIKEITMGAGIFWFMIKIFFKKTDGKENFMLHPVKELTCDINADTPVTENIDNQKIFITNGFVVVTDEDTAVQIKNTGTDNIVEKCIISFIKMY